MLPWRGEGTYVADAVRARVIARLRLADTAFRLLTKAAACGVLIILGGVMISLVAGSLPALREVRLRFPDRAALEPGHREFGAAAPIYGTIVTSFIAMLVAVPVGLLIAVFLTELCPLCSAADRHRHRAAGGNSEHHSTASGVVRLRALPAGHLAAVSDRGLRQRAGAVVAVRRAALRNRHAGRHAAFLRHRGAPNHLDLARRSMVPRCPQRAGK